jgi:hypothetical protein
MSYKLQQTNFKIYLHSKTTMMNKLYVHSEATILTVRQTFELQNLIGSTEVLFKITIID